MAVSMHQGGCHCGAVRYQAELDGEAEALTCNCSMCGRAGTLLQFITPDKFKLERGEDHLTDYQFNKHVIHHLFCKTCGIKAFSRGEGPRGPMIAINVRTLDGIDAFAIKTKPFDGRSH